MLTDLFEAEPRLVLSMGFHQLRAFVAIVELVRSAVGVPTLGEHPNPSLATICDGTNSPVCAA